MNQSMNDEAVYRTAPATPGLLKTSNKMCEKERKYKSINPNNFYSNIDYL